MGLAFIASVGVSIMLGLSLHFLTDAIPKLARIAVIRAARRLPTSMILTQEAAWLADLATLETHFEMLSCAIACVITSYRIHLPFVAEKTLRDLNTARSRLRMHGALTSFALNRIKAWDIPTDPHEWTWSERWCVGIILASKAPIEQLMKTYLIALERDVIARPRRYESQEDLAKDILMPIWREMKIYEFLSKYDVEGILCINNPK